MTTQATRHRPYLLVLGVLAAVAVTLAILWGVTAAQKSSTLYQSFSVLRVTDKTEKSGTYYMTVLLDESTYQKINDKLRERGGASAADAGTLLPENPVTLQVTPELYQAMAQKPLDTRLSSMQVSCALPKDQSKLPKFEDGYQVLSKPYQPFCLITQITEQSGGQLPQ